MFIFDALPEKDGLYAVEVYHGWTFLEFRDGSWWHRDFIARWTAGNIVQWVGPLPERQGMKPKAEFDL